MMIAKEQPWAVELYVHGLLLSHLARSFETIDEASDKSVLLTQTLSDEAYEAGARWCAVHNTFYKHAPAPDGLMARPNPPDQTVEEWLDWLAATPGASEAQVHQGATDDDLSGIAWARDCKAFWAKQRREKEPKTSLWPAPPANPIPLLTYTTAPILRPLTVLAIYAAPDYAEDTYQLLLEEGYLAACSGTYLSGLCSYWPMFLETRGEG